MLRAEDVRIFVATRPVDFRGSFDRLGGFVREHLGADPRSGSLYVFLNKQGTKVKVLFFDRTGDCLVYKRLLLPDLFTAPVERFAHAERGRSPHVE